MKKLIVLLASLLILTACAQAPEEAHTAFVESELPGLYEVTYRDYSWDDTKDHLGTPVEDGSGGAFGCSSVHYGNFVGRSFDYFLLDWPEFLIRTNHENGHFASIGISLGSSSLSKERIAAVNSGNKTENDILSEKLLPFTMLDGINENGVVCSMNVVPAHDLPPHEGEEAYRTHGTNPEKEDLYYIYALRYLLDNAESAKHGVELLRERNITTFDSKGGHGDIFNLSSAGFELHYMIADKDETYVVELVNDEMRVVSADIMTNYYLSVDTPSGTGYEREKLLLLGRDSVKTVSDMKALIEKVKYSNTYRTDIDSGDFDPLWSEISSGYAHHSEAEQYCREHWDELRLHFDELYAKIKNGETSPVIAADVPWISMHADVYDIENRALHICVRENYEKWAEYGIDR